MEVYKSLIIPSPTRGKASMGTLYMGILALLRAKAQKRSLPGCCLEMITIRANT